MEKDNAIKKALIGQEDINFPFTLRNKILLNINKEAEKQMKLKYIYGILLISCISLILTAGTIFLLVTRFGLVFNFPTINLSFVSNPLFLSSLYLASIVLLLLILDDMLRKMFFRVKE